MWPLPPPRFYMDVADTPAAAAQGTPTSAQTPTPAEVDAFITLSRSLSGGGRFDTGMAKQLLGWMNADAVLRRGLDELLKYPAVALGARTASPEAGNRSSPSEIDAAVNAILTFWFVGYFNGEPIPGRSEAYDGLLAWQAMYTEPVATCKEFGGWAQPPNTEPVVLGT